VFLDALRLDPGLLAGRADLFAPALYLAGQCFQPGAQRFQVADRMGVRDRLQQPVDGRPGAAWRQVGGSEPLFEQGDFGLQRLELAPVEGQCLIRAACLP
jgi:hypothetical protein